jgi:hypothetical protein
MAAMRIAPVADLALVALVALVALIGVGACGGAAPSGRGAASEPPSPPAADPCAADPCAADPCSADPCAADPCSPAPHGASPGRGPGAPRSADASREEIFGPLEVGADYARYRRLTDRPFRSLVHGNRFVHVYVNEVGAAAYLAGSEIPVGTVIVKTSVENVGGAPSAIAGPIFVMQKRAPGYDPAHGDWWYAMHWANPPPDQAQRFGGPIYWRGRSPRVAYCWKCHDDYAHGLGGLVPSSLLPR